MQAYLARKIAAAIRSVHFKVRGTANAQVNALWMLLAPERHRFSHTTLFGENINDLRNNTHQFLPNRACLEVKQVPTVLPLSQHKRERFTVFH